MRFDHAEARTPDGRTLRYVEAGEPDGPLLLSQHGTPGCGRLYRSEVEGAQRLGARLVAYSRPGYDGSTPDAGRSVADAAADVAALLDALGAERFATYGWSGGGPHALACAALLPARCAAAATIAGAAPSDRPDLEFMAGMGDGNVQEFRAAFAGRETLTPMLEQERAGLLAVSPEQVVEAMAPFLSDVDAGALTGELAGHLLGMFRAGLADGVDGWVDDDLAFVEPWGFDLGGIAVPVAIWQGDEDLMVPGAHGRWLAANVGGAEAHLPEREGHLTLFANRIGDIQAWLAERL
jgi:pimeloyl-ACP methyl ester carboxylesterase